MGRRPSRQACDRCHGLQLRCDRTSAAKHCRRCLKAGATCVFNMSTRGRQLVGNKPTPSTPPVDEKPVPHNSTEDASISESTASDRDVNPDARKKELPPEPLCQNPHDTSRDFDSGSSSLNPTASASNPLTDFAFDDGNSIGQTPTMKESAEMGPFTSLASPKFADSNLMAPRLSAHASFRVQFMRDLLVLDVELIQLTSVFIAPTEDGLPQAFADKTLTIAQQLLEILHSAEWWTWQTSCPQTWYPGQYQPSIPSGWEQPETSLDQMSTIHALSTYLRLVEAYQILCTRVASNYTPIVANGSWNPFSCSFQSQDSIVDGPAIQSAMSAQPIVPLMNQLSCLVQRLTMPCIEADVVRAMMATVREQESQMMEGVTRLQQIGFDRL